MTIAAAQVTATTDSTKPSLLIFTKTRGYRHESIPHGISMVTTIGAERGWSVDATEDSSIFTTEGLSPYTALVFISTTGNFLVANESDALQEYMLNGGAWLGIHAAFPPLENFPRSVILTVFMSDGNTRPDIITIQTHDHPSTANLPHFHTRTDEWYAYKTNPNDDPTYTVLATLNETYIDEITLEPELEHMEPHSISWYSLYEGVGRAFYTGMGHTSGTYYEPYFIEHITGGLEWVTGVAN
ncbi:Crp/FNR family transcriptional regulator [Bisporella sp. PMI_857]|nr:Crp/FNR family transcriptional regulator [Bisporella sp. PMI_857]